jgi:hypothetical protein
MSELLKDYQALWSLNSDKMSNRFSYQECDAQLSMFGYMQKAFNGKVQLIKELTAGTGFVDVCAVYETQRFPVELKVKTKHGWSKPESINQLLGYMDNCQSKEGWLVVYDRDSKKPWQKNNLGN